MSQNLAPHLENNPVQAQDANCPNPDILNNGHDPKAFVSTGRKIHNELTYRGINWILNSSIGVLFAFWSSRTKSGQKIFGDPVNKIFKGALKPILETESAVNEGAKWGTTIISIIIGGMSIIPLMVSMEKKENKKSLVRWMDKKIYGKAAVENDPKFEESYKCIDDEPKQDFKTGMVARGIVLAPMIAATAYPNVNKYMVKGLYAPIAKVSRWLCDRVGLKPKKLMEQGVMEIANGDLKSAPQFVSHWDYIHRTIGIDLGLTFIYSYAHEFVYKALANGNDKKEKEAKANHAAEPVLDITPAALPAPLAKPHQMALSTSREIVPVTDDWKTKLKQPQASFADRATNETAELTERIL